jgi:serine/threonine protein kinase/tetratricopeptide (TPR) repeat protein
MSAAFGRYRLLERLGQGGMAEVFKAKSFGVEGFEKVLVIKRILPELARSQQFVDMFIHEAKLAVRLSHANIVQVFDLGIAPVTDEKGVKQPDAYFMAMEFVHGIDLATLLAKCRRQQKAVPIELAVFVCAEVAKGLDHAHRRRDEQLKALGIVHCDVSPQNVLLSYEGEVKVTDFGIAKARGVLEQNVEDTRSRQLHGKFGYMSPEQARGEAVDARSDIFSLGVVLYELLAGVNPFSAPTTFETLRRVQACEYPPVELLRPDVPGDLVKLLKTALAKDAKDRFADAGRFYEALLAFLYSTGGRYTANDLSEFLARYAQRDENAPASSAPSLGDPSLESETQQAQERTPVEVPPSRVSQTIKAVDPTARFVDIDRAAGLGERREVTALYVELPRGVDGEVIAAAAPIVERYGGFLARRERDELAAIFGLGDPDGRDTEVATRCALVTLRALVGPAAQSSAGIHTGRIHVTAEGKPTEDDRLSGLISSARELARAREGRVAISGAAMRQVKGLFIFEPIGGDTSKTPTPVLAGSLVKDVRGPNETLGRFVGRKDELRKIGEVLASATRRQARVLTIRGGHGVGKTRLLVEVERRLGKGNYNVGFYISTCPPRGREYPLSGIVCMLQVLCGVSEGDPSERIIAVQPRLRALGLHDEEVGAVLTALGANVPTYTGANAKSSLRSAFTRMVVSLCEDKPHTFAWDNAHNMDEDSFSILSAAFEKLSHARVVFAFTAREGFAHPLEKGGSHVSIDLTDLKSTDDVQRLVALRLGTQTAPDELVRFVRERAGGHPLFIEEIIKGLLDANAVSVAEGRVVSMKLLGQELALPKTLRGLVASRVSRLDANAKATLQAAAVLGEPIDSAVLARMVNQPLAALERLLASLKSNEFLAHTSASELHFTSPIIREVVVDALPQDAARDMHAAAGLALEQELGERSWEQAARIATHFYEAGDREQAATYFAKSGERRLEARQLEAAVRDYARAIELCDMPKRDARELATWLDALGTGVRMVRSAPEAEDTCARVIARLDKEGDPELRVRGRVAASRILVAIHKFEAAGPHLSEAERIAAGNDELMKTVLVAYAELAGRRGDFNRSLELLVRMQKLATVEGDKQEEHKILTNLSQAHAALGDRVNAKQALDRAEQLVPDDTAAACERQKLRGLMHYFLRDFRLAAVEIEKAVDLARGLGLTYEVAVNLHNLGDVLIRLDDYARAYGALQQSLALCEEYGFERLVIHNRMLLAYLAGYKGDLDGEKQLDQGISYAEANEFWWDVISGRLLRARLLQKHGKHEEAKHAFHALRALAKTNGHRMVVDDCDAALAEYANAKS